MKKNLLLVAALSAVLFSAGCSFMNGKKEEGKAAEKTAEVKKADMESAD